MLSRDVTRWESVLTPARSIGMHAFGSNVVIVSLVSSNVCFIGYLTRFGLQRFDLLIELTSSSSASPGPPSHPRNEPVGDVEPEAVLPVFAARQRLQEPDPGLLHSR